MTLDWSQDGCLADVAVVAIGWRAHDVAVDGVDSVLDKG